MYSERTEKTLLTMSGDGFEADFEEFWQIRVPEGV